MAIDKNISPRDEKGLSGKWQGQYTYGPSYGSRLQGQSVPFTVLIQIEGSGRLTGECLDDGYADQVDAKAFLEGRLVNSQIEFVKKYQHHWHTKADGSVEENKNRESHEVHYAGVYQYTYFSGNWKIFSTYVGKDGLLRERELGGFWIMHRADE